MISIKFSVSLATFGLLAGFVCHAVESEIALENPVRPAKDDEVLQLPDFGKTSFKQFSGYLAAKEHGGPEEKRFLHYWLVESENETDSDTLYLWLNGGPGCSSMSTLLRSNGPVTIDSDGKVVKNPFSWNQLGNVLYIDGPVGTGFSYSPKGQAVSNDDTAVEDLFNALKSFYRKFPNYREKTLYIGGESYAAVYISMLAERIIEKDPAIKIRTLMIGNGYTDAKRLGESYVFYSYYHGLIDTAAWREISTYCCDGNIPDHKKCHFSGTSIKCLEHIQHLGSFVLDPKPGLNPQNLYDSDYLPPRFEPSQSPVQIEQAGPSGTKDDQTQTTTLKSLEDNGEVDEITSEQESRSVSRIPVGQSLVPRQQQMCSKQTNLQIISNELLTNSLRALASNNSIEEIDLSDGNQEEMTGEGDWPLCANADFSIYHENYMNRRDVRLALHIPDRLQKPFKQCSRQVFLSYKQVYPFQRGGIDPTLKKVLKSRKDLDLIMYNGDVDLVANFIGNEWFAEELGFKMKEPHRPIMIENKVAGFMKLYEKVLYVTIKGAGHSPLTEKPKLFFELISNPIKTF